MIPESDGKCLRIHVLDVGHGDSIIIEWPGRKRFAIVDCKRHTRSNRAYARHEPHDPSEPKTLSFMRRKVRKLEEEGTGPEIAFACLTHPHYDHFRGYGQLLRGLAKLRIPVREFWRFGAVRLVSRAMALAAQKERLHEAALDEFVDLKRALELLAAQQGQLRMQTLTADRPDNHLYEDDDLQIQVVAPTTRCADLYQGYLMLTDPAEKRQYRQAHPSTDTGNLISSALIIKYGAFRACLGGDLTNRAWEEILADDELDLRCHAVKASHHGSLDGNRPNDEPLWGSIALKGQTLQVAISGGYRFALPHEDVLEDLRKAQADVYVTGSGNVRMKPFAPAGIPVPELSDEVAMTLRELDEDVESMSGDICIDCFADGQHDVHCERLHEVA